MLPDREAYIVGCILGTAIGDAVGLCAEGMSRRRLTRFYPDLDGPHFLFGRGMTSDDTEHTCMLAQALLVSGGDVNRFARRLAWRMRFWLLGLPAGIGRATLRAILKLWLGFPPDKSGVFSAGNGPSMRSALLGVCFGDDPQKLQDHVRASTRLTHTDPKAEHGALAVALAAHHAACGRVDPGSFCRALRERLRTDAAEFMTLVERAAAGAEVGTSTEAFAESLGLTWGVSGYTYHTVPVALHAWMRHPQDFRAAVRAVVRCGGDTDSTGAITGAIVGAGVGQAGIPTDWLARLWEWPRSVAWMERLGRELSQAGGNPRPALWLNLPGLLVRNLAFFVLVLIHAARRLGPPY
jgi:ADP-ribosylglycohydrolase